MTENTSSFPRSSGELHEFTRADVWGGFTQLLPLSFFVVVFGLAFGVAAVQTGLDAFPTLLMSTLVFAGASQFATLEMWGAEVPLVPVLITVFAINARHLLMGATLYPWLRQLPPHKRYGIMLLASDANWAMAMNAFGKKEPGFGLLVGGGLALWGFWIVGTWMVSTLVAPSKIQSVSDLIWSWVAFYFLWLQAALKICVSSRFGAWQQLHH